MIGKQRQNTYMMKFLRRYKDLGINGLTARWYDKNSHHHRIDELRSYAREVTKHVKKGDFVLEMAGTRVYGN
jgi:hypothetical protein